MGEKNNNTYTLTMQAINNNEIKKQHRKMLREVRGLSYIGGNKKETHDTFWKKFPKISAAVDSVANAYNINVETLKNRLNHEGFVDTVIEDNNRAYLEPEYYNKYPEDSILNSQSAIYLDDGFQKFGLDYTHGLIQEGKVKPINEKYETSPTDYNEMGVQVPAAHGLTNLDNIGLVAATLQYTRALAKKNHPNLKGKHLDEASIAYYNLSPAGAKKMINSGKLDSRYKIK
ncbi:MAG: hypothetical protein J6Y28_09635 [Acholeplasmatales bacterium]|nr:hypothetical protein [Methanobrevibacter sp.]MBP5446419.1 hypothetical protein [Acholeplasmatales bacterium]